ncbi:ATP-binding protein [uncultured Deinococcus sp.]|uniref:ATP-binding protein n=1 Tax=uncultured Deinococcus sp. TaxID=158789 RepID=UPI0025F7C94D|nr:ATP-binding protein [uncultured Deinococcus sp.]
MTDAVFIVDEMWCVTYGNHIATTLVAPAAANLLGSTLWDAVPEFRHTALFAWRHGRPPRDLNLEIDVRHAASGRRYLGRAVTRDDALTVHLSDVTERRHAQGRRDALLSVVVALGRTSTAAEVIEIALQTGLPAVGAAAGAVFRLAAAGDRLEIVGAQGYSAQQLAHWADLPLDMPLPILEAWKRQVPVYVTRPEDFLGDAALGTRSGSTAALAALPLRADGVPTGLLAVGFDTGRAFDASERDVMVLLADQIGHALGRVQVDAEREHAVEALVRERSRLTAVLEQLPVALWLAELPGGRLIGGNAAITRDLGLEFLAAQSSDQYAVYTGFHDDGRPYASQDWPMARTVRTGETVRDEDIEMRRADGRRIRVRFSSTAIRDPDGTAALAVVSGVDVTALHDLSVRLETVVAERTAALDAFVQFTEEAGLTTDVRGLTQVAVTMLQRLLEDVSVTFSHLDGDRWVAQVWSGDIAPEMADSVTEGVPVTAPGYAEALHTHRPVFVSWPDGPAGDRPPQASGHGAGMLYPCVVNGVVYGLLVVRGRTTGAWTDRELQVAQSVGRSLTLALQRSAEDAALRRQRDVLDARAQTLSEANEALDAFALSVSHDLRTPVRHVLGYTDLLRRGLGDRLDPKHQRFLTVVSEAAERMNVMIDALLDAARTSQQPLRRTEVNLARLIGEVQRELTQALPERDVQWAVGSLPSVPGDEALLRQVLANLLENALKYTQTRRPARIEVWAEEQISMWMITVRDNGVGFDPQHTHKLFGAFQRLHTSREFEGVGIGLANVRRIVTRHGGDVWAEGVLDGGATLRFTLPTAEAE